MSFMFEKLDVYQKPVDFADHASALTETFPRGYHFLADQLNRAAHQPVSAPDTYRRQRRGVPGMRQGYTPLNC